MGTDPEEIQARRFRHALLGYDRREVAQYLTELAAAQRELIAAHDGAMEAAARNAANERIANERLNALEREAHRQAEREADLNSALASGRQDDLVAALTAEIMGIVPTDDGDDIDIDDDIDDDDLAAEAAAMAEELAADEQAQPAVEEPAHEPDVQSTQSDDREEPAAAGTAAPELDRDPALAFTNELTAILRSTQERVVGIEASATAEADAVRAAAERHAADVRAAADAWAQDQRTRADLEHGRATDALVAAQAEAAALLQDAHRRAGEITRSAEADGNDRVDTILAAAQDRISQLTDIEVRLRRRLGAARVDLASALEALDSLDVDGPPATVAPTPHVIDLSSRARSIDPPPAAPTELPQAIDIPLPATGTAATATISPPSPPVVTTTVFAPVPPLVLTDAESATEALDAAESAVADDDEAGSSEDVYFNRIVRDALDRAVRQTRTSPRD